MDKILIKNGLVYDPALKEKTVKDIALSGGFITGVSGFKPDQIVEASGCLVVPGLIDFHVHCLPSAADIGIEPDIFCLPHGVTCCVDAGSAGVSGFETAFRHTICRSAVTVKALLHFCSGGQITGIYPENQTPQNWNREAIRETVKKFRPIIKGMKLRFSDHVLTPFGLGNEVLKEGIRLAEELALPLVLHINNPGTCIDEIAGLLRKGDVFCHAYSGSRENILDPAGKTRDSVLAARERGVIFDAASGRRNFLFDVASKAIEQGFLPDIISTDMNSGCFNKQPVISFPRLLSRYLALGMRLEDVIDRATINPARWLGIEESASLAEGSPADIAVFRIIEKETVFSDSAGVCVKGKEIIIPQLTIKNGTVMYAQPDFI